MAREDDLLETATRTTLLAAAVEATEAAAEAAEKREAALLDRVEDVLGDEFGLAELGKVIVRKWLRKMACEPQGLERVRDWFLSKLGGGKRARHRMAAPKWQHGCPDLVPGLRAMPFWERDPSVGDAVRRLEGAAMEIASEFRSARASPVFQPYRAPNWVNPGRVAADGVGSLGHDKGDWNVCYLHLHNVDFSANREVFPKTAALIESIPRWYCHAFISVLAPGTHIAKHNGPTNKKLRLHLPLQVPDGGVSGIRVGSETRVFAFGRCVAFDDSFEHEAWNKHPAEGRVCLIVDLWHPDLSDREVTLLKFLEKAKMNKAKLLCASAATDAASAAPSGPDKDDAGFVGNNFYSLLGHTRHLARPLGPPDASLAL